MNIFFDTNVLLDVALRREPHFSASNTMFVSAIQRGNCYVSWHTISNLSYILSKFETKKVALEFIEQLTTVCRIAPIDHDDFRVALQHNSGDLEDAMQIACAIAAKSDVIVTRDPKGFKKSPIPLVDPKAFE